MYYLSLDKTKRIEFDPKLHSLEKLHRIMDDEYLEYACAYVFYYNMILNLKDKNELNEEVLENVKVMMERYTDEKDLQVCKRHGITLDFLQSWIKKFATDR